MADGESTALERMESTGFVELVQEGANLDPEEWPAAKIATIRGMLPKAAQKHPRHMIQYLARAERAGLDPFLDELHAWEDRGDLVFYTGRDGWLRIAQEDPNVEGVEFGAIHEKDEFDARKEAGQVMVNHTVKFPRGDLVGAYAAVHMADGMDAMVAYEWEDFSHLHGKDNWRKYPDVMLVTRCISEVIGMKCPAGAGIHSEAGLTSGRQPGDMDRRKAKAAADAEADALAAELAEETETEVDAEPVEADVVEGEAGIAEEPAEAETVPADEAEDEEPDVEMEPCRICGEEIPAKGRGRGGHMGGHTRKDEELPEGYRVQKEGDGAYLLVDPDGEIHGVGEDDSTFSDYTFALKAAARLEKEGTDPIEAAQERLPSDWALHEQDGSYHVTDNEGSIVQDPRDGGPGGRAFPTPSKAADAALRAYEELRGSEAEQEDEAPSPEEVEDWGTEYKSLVAFVNQHKGENDMAFIREQAEKLFPDCVEDGTPRIRLLDAEQIRDLREECEEVLG